MSPPYTNLYELTTHLLVQLENYQLIRIQNLQFTNYVAQSLQKREVKIEKQIARNFV